MGDNKLLLPLGGVSTLERVIETMLALPFGELIVVTGAGYAETEKIAAARNLRVVRNEDFEDGLASSIRAGVPAVSHDSLGVLFALADMPLVRASTVEALCAEFAHRQNERPIVVPSVADKRGNPVIFHLSYLPELSALQGDVGARGIIKRHAELVRAVETEDEGVLADMDTPEDFRRVSETFAKG